MVVAFRFEETPPCLTDLQKHFEIVLGESLFEAIDSIELGVTSPTGSDHVVSVLSQDLVAMAYVRKACSDLGAVRVKPWCGERLEHNVPSWTNTPWHQYDWWRRLKIRFGRLLL